MTESKGATNRHVLTASPQLGTLTINYSEGIETTHGWFYVRNGSVKMIDTKNPTELSHCSLDEVVSFAPNKGEQQ